MYRPSRLKAIINELWLGSNWATQSSWKELLKLLLMAVSGYMLLDQLLLRLTSLSLPQYKVKFLFLEVIKKTVTEPLFGAILVVTVVLFHKTLLLPWSRIHNGKVIRALMIGSGFILCWKYVLSDYNYFFDTWYYPDRILMIGMAILIFFKPVFVLPFLLALLTFIGQFEILPVYSLAADFLLIGILLLFLTFFILMRWTKEFQFREFLFLTGCLIAAHYFESGILKVNPEWLLHDQVRYLLPNTHSTGWLSFVSADEISSITRFLSWFNWPIKAFTIFLECGMLFLFAHRKWARMLLICAIFFHLGILVMTGIFFWMWILILLPLIAFTRKKNNIELQRLFTRKYFLLSLFLIALGEFWCDPVGLGWHDVPINYTYRFKATFDDGTDVVLPPNFFSPYDYQFTLTNFKFISSSPMLAVVWGSSNRQTSRLFHNARTAHEVFNLELETGKAYRNSEKAQFLESFVRKFVRNWNESDKRWHFINYLQPPRLVLSFPTKVKELPYGNILYVRILEITTLYSDEHGYSEIREREVGRVHIP